MGGRAHNFIWNHFRVLVEKPLRLSFYIQVTLRAESGDPEPQHSLRLLVGPFIHSSFLSTCVYIILFHVINCCLLSPKICVWKPLSVITPHFSNIQHLNHSMKSIRIAVVANCYI